jgi:5,10-methylene-tetrahydrofolate dehydrogenase/methenyl tetrahydrofolate cyclohydrolase
VVIVGNRKDSQSYVGMKRKACAEVGIKSFDIDLPEQVSEAEVVSKVHELNTNPDVHGWSVLNVYIYIHELDARSVLCFESVYIDY